MIRSAPPEIDHLFQTLDPALFLRGRAARTKRFSDLSRAPIRTYVDETGLTLSAISDRGFMAWIVASLMPLAGRRVLEVGTGTGYLAYALAQFTGETGTVAGCEIIRELFDASVRNPLICSVPRISLYLGDFVNVVPKLGLFDVVVATSAMSSIHPVLLRACNPDGGLIGLPIEIQGGGDCFTIFRREGVTIRPIAAMLSISVPTTGKYTEDPAWLTPIDRILPDIDLSRALCIKRENSLGHPVYGTLGLRSFLQAHEPLFAAVSLAGDNEPFVERAAFGIINQDSGSFCLQWADQWIVFGQCGLALAEQLTWRIQAWEADGKPSLADFRYQLSATEKGVSFGPAILERAGNWQRV
jgi:protein-L-isoaspartate O-methyltransferase